MVIPLQIRHSGRSFVRFQHALYRSSSFPGRDDPVKYRAGLGLVAIGSRYGYEVLAALNDTSAGDPPMDRSFSQTAAIPNYIAVLLSWPNDTAETYNGEMTFSEILPEFQNITNCPTSRYPYFSQEYIPISMSLRYF